MIFGGNAVVVESVDTGDLKSPGGDTVRVRVPSTAPRKRETFLVSLFLCWGKDANDLMRMSGGHSLTARLDSGSTVM